MELEDAIRNFYRKFHKNSIFSIKPDFRLVQFCYGLRQNTGSANAVQNLVQWYINNAPLADYWRNDAMGLLNSLSCLTSDTQVEQ